MHEFEDTPKRSINFLDMFKSQMAKIGYQVIINDTLNSIASKALSKSGYMDEDKSVFLHQDVAKVAIENGYPVVELASSPDYHGSHKGEYYFSKVKEFDENSLINLKSYFLHPDLTSDEKKWLYEDIIRKCKYPDLSEKSHASIQKDGRMVGMIDDNGVLFAESIHMKKISPLFKQLDEVVENYNKGDELQEVKGYKLFSEINKVLLACKQMASGELEFATWERDFDGNGVSLGHYFSEYENAKQDFAGRSGLIDKSRLFDDVELKLIYSGLVQSIELNSEDFTQDKKHAIKSLIHKIEDLVPGVITEIENDKEAIENEYEHEMGD